MPNNLEVRMGRRSRLDLSMLQEVKVQKKKSWSLQISSKNPKSIKNLVPEFQEEHYQQVLLGLEKLYQPRLWLERQVFPSSQYQGLSSQKCSQEQVLPECETFSKRQDKKLLQLCLSTRSMLWVRKDRVKQEVEMMRETILSTSSLLKWMGFQLTLLWSFLPQQIEPIYWIKPC